MATRRNLLGATCAVTLSPKLASSAIAASNSVAEAPEKSQFVRRVGTQLSLGDRPYRFVGANLWYAAWLGSTASFGDRSRLMRELDRLQDAGVTNLRILAGAEKSPLRNAISPAFRDETSIWNPKLVEGLDFALEQIASRQMKATLYLTNFWEWSGGMMTLLSYVNGGKFLNMNDPSNPWPAFPNMTAQFYASARAVELYHEYVRFIVSRHRGNPAIMAWQLANEPRPGGSEQIAVPLLPAFYGWIESTAALIKSVDRVHLLSTGSEGLKGSIEREDIFRRAHQSHHVDYLTAHIWPLNWSWLDAKDIAGTHRAAAEKVAAYLYAHEKIAVEMGKPLVIEEFGYPRDTELYTPGSPTKYRDLYYRQIFESVEASARHGGPIAGSNFWAWNGEGRAQHPDARFRDGDTSYVGDPPHEPQGWYGVFDSDATTLAIIREHAGSLQRIAAKQVG